MRTLQVNALLVLSFVMILITFGETHAAERVKTGIANVNGTTLYYEIAGKGFPIVLISGGGTLDRRAWDDQFEALAKSYKVIRYDIRGIGMSAQPREPFSHSKDLYALLKALKIRKTHIVGLSFSGAIALDFALEHPEMVDHLVLAATGLSSDAKSKANVDGLLFLSAMAKKEGIDRAIQFVIDLPFFISQDNLAAREKIRQNYLDNRAMFESDFSLITLWQPTQPPPEQRLSTVRSPVLILEAEKDNPGYRAMTAKLIAGIAGAQTVVIPGGAHLLHLDKPKQFNQAVLDFLSRK